MVARQAGRHPGAIALIGPDTRLTYRELDQSAGRLARYLTDLGAGPETVVGVCLERGADAVRSMLAIMKAGSGYLPLDPSLPPARLARMCEQARPLAVLTAGTRIPGARLLGPGDVAAGLADRPAEPPPVAPPPVVLAAWPASSASSRPSTRSGRGTGCCSSPRSPSTPRSSRYSSR
jgi:non-ribosomal peptide synthetase component F